MTTETRRNFACGLRSVLVVFALAATAFGCGEDDRPTKGDPGGGATETNVAPAPCTSSSDCPPGIACTRLDGGDAGFCDVNEMQVEPGTDMPVSSAAPAPCSAAEPCPPGIECVYANGGSVGFCDVVEMEAP